MAVSALDGGSGDGSSDGSGVGALVAVVRKRRRGRGEEEEDGEKVSLVVTWCQVSGLSGGPISACLVLGCSLVSGMSDVHRLEDDEAEAVVRAALVTAPRASRGR